jgi:hypothetical protein
MNSERILDRDTRDHLARVDPQFPDHGLRDVVLSAGVDIVSVDQLGA